MNVLYPIFLKLKDKPVIVVGGGKVAYRKVKSLLNAGAKITVVSPELDQDLRDLVEGDKITYLQREYQAGDLKNACLVIAATGDQRVNRQIWQEAERKNLLVNVVDDPEQCNFYVPAVYRNGDLSIAISTQGKAPLLAKFIRQYLEKILDNGFAQVVELVARRREQLKRELPHDADRRQLLLKEFTDKMIKELEIDFIEVCGINDSGQDEQNHLS
ncbi:bifunctional precorrin-2 dehydrogenase/sirohydrochlorin ferrochelatase [candidate division KSB1 bacterium]|nr:MAG: bifunctional precorrin-2 dehydrogenase/sirohydrochlorin ferrochelatase [candidate division KSB1 bacterium]